MRSNPQQLAAAWPVLILLVIPALALGETGVQAWIQRYNGPGSSYSNADGASAVAVDGSNDVIVTGSSVGSGTYNDYATVKYSSTGVPLWTNRYDGPVSGTDLAAAVAVDGNNEVIVTGASDAGAESTMDYATIKYSSTGEPLWTNRYTGPVYGGDRPCALAVDGRNDVVVTGYSYSGTDSGSDYATIKYSSDGETLWINRYTGSGNYGDDATALAVDHRNDVIVTGSSFSNQSMLSSDWATVKYSSEGVPLWTNLYNGPGDSLDMPSAVAVDGNNDVVVTGRSTGSEGSSDCATIKYSSDGVPLWTNRYPNGNGRALAVDRSNNVIVAGASGSGWATIKYSSAGAPLWTNYYSGPPDGYGEAVAAAVNGSNDVVVTGWSASTNVLPYNYDYATIKYSSAGVALWTNRYNGPGNSDDKACALAVDPSGNVIVTGYATTGGYNTDFATIKYICVLSPVLTGIELTSAGFRLRVDGVLQPGTLVLEAATNLAAWTPVFTNTTSTNLIFYTDAAATNARRRFYRSYQFP